MKIICTTILLLLSTIIQAQVDTSNWQDVKIKVCLENEQVHKYITETSYSTAYIRYTYNAYNKVTRYSNVATNYRKDQPAPAIIPLPLETDADMFLVICDSINTDKKDTITIEKRSKEVHLWNLIPSRTYYYHIGDITKGTIHTTGQLRQLRIDSGFNIRDIGGYMTSSGKRLRHGRIYRGSELSDGNYANLTEEDLIKLKNVGIGAEIDLRALIHHKSGELLTESPLGKDIVLKSLPMLDKDVVILNEYENEYREAFYFIHQQLKKGHPIYIHCTFGADRTGLMCSMLEGLCGVSISDIYKDYELTSMTYLEANESYINRYYSTVNLRMTQVLGIKSIDEIQGKIRAYLTERCKIESHILDEIVQMLVENENDLFNTEPDTHIEELRPQLSSQAASYYIDGRRAKGSTRGIVILHDENGNTRKQIRR